MDPFTFAQRVSSQEKSDPELGNWAHRYLENSALQTLRAAFYVEDAGSPVLDDYRKTLRSTLESLPEHVNLEVSQGLFDALVRIAGSDFRELLVSKVKTAISRT
ncbi:hypothetical protein KF728_25285 [Candidatus Obscuribacterales bacterium]|nr:hypothetical protein [Candidatus Obscuribacterales bacterium]MBX3153492.1 hypothetical protein [Candidatus Obscuribacterales bacterium]